MLKIGEFAQEGQVTIKTLRHYAKLGLLKPIWTDRFTGYRYYSREQLSRLNRIMALKDLGFTLEQIGQVLQEEMTLDELRGMLRLKQAELAQHIREEQARLARIEERLRRIEQADDLFLSLTTQLKEQIIMKPEIVNYSAFTAVGLMYHGTHAGEVTPPRHYFDGKTAVLLPKNGRFALPTRTPLVPLSDNPSCKFVPLSGIERYKSGQNGRFPGLPFPISALKCDEYSCADPSLSDFPVSAHSPCASEHGIEIWRREFISPIYPDRSRT